MVGNFGIWQRQPIPKMGLQDLRGNTMTSPQQQNLTISDRGLVLEETPYPSKLDLTSAFIFAKAISSHEPSAAKALPVGCMYVTRSLEAY